ncbi:MAG: hypothetical protein KF773_08260 [Deltaproteobacteria bacterium]|nr:hypothetical protein [Deltaproteobacteria bacterium]MCW5806312.1 hypothetical protein [Deltaproteobacteria bacterium]
MVVALCILGGAAWADDDTPELQRMRFVERGDALTVSTKISQLFDNPAYNALDSGFTSTVVIRVWVYPKDSTAPISFVLLRRQVVYNLWDETYELRFDEPSGRRDFKEKRKSEALRVLTSLDDLPIARLSVIPHEQIFLLAVQVELNPVSRETLAAVRRWLTQGQGGGLDRGGAFFGSFVSVFVNPKIPEADRVVRLRSQPFFRPTP